MKHHLNTLFVTTQGAYLSKEGQTVLVRIEQETRLRVPVHTLGGIVCFGQVSCSPALMAFCAEQGVAISFLTAHGQFQARVEGFVRGNVLLRRQQYRLADEAVGSLRIARNIVLAKIANSRTVLLRAVRDHGKKQDTTVSTDAIRTLDRCLGDANAAITVEGLRGVEGYAGRAYFSAFDQMITTQKEDFQFHERSRRPPLDNINALLSFLYSILAHDARAACEAAGLDSAVGFLHEDRPGRAGLALDLTEEFRAFLADRVALSLINRRQVAASGFRRTETGAIHMDEETRKIVLVAYQTRKQEELRHPFLGETTTVGLLPHLQARLLARFIRGDIDTYPPFIAR